MTLTLTYSQLQKDTHTMKCEFYVVDTAQVAHMSQPLLLMIWLTATRPNAQRTCPAWQQLAGSQGQASGHRLTVGPVGGSKGADLLVTKGIATKGAIGTSQRWNVT